MVSPINLEQPESLTGLPTINELLSPTSADAPLLALLGQQLDQMSEEELRKHVETLRTLRKTPQKMSAKMVEGSETKRPKKVSTIRKAEATNMANSYLSGLTSAASATDQACPKDDASPAKLLASETAKGDTLKDGHSAGTQPNLL